MARDKYDDAPMYTVLVACELQATGAREAAQTALKAVDIRDATTRGQDYGDVYVQRVERPLKRVESIEVVRKGDLRDDE